MITVTSKLHLPTDMLFLPSGDIFVLEKGTGAGTNGRSAVRLVRNGMLAEQPVLTLSTTITGEAGLTGVVLDPNFPNNHYFYLWYTVGEAAKNWRGELVNRLSRFVYDEQHGTADSNSEVILLEDQPWGYHHHGGALMFGADGYLYVGLGDRELANIPQNLGMLNGKVLRIQPTAMGYAIPPDNPWVDVEGVRAEIYSYGLRNPFRITRRQQDQKLFMLDVGELAWEEINEVLPGANYGWDLREGPCPKGEFQPCPAAPPGYTDPVVYYPHANDLNPLTAISALAFYEGSGYPAEYHNQLFFADFGLRQIQWVATGNDGFVLTPFAANTGMVVDMEYFKEHLYYLVFDRGEINMITYAEAPNQAPTAQLTADTVLGAAPLTVHFSAAESQDPDDAILQYRWDWGDGTPTLLTQSTVVSHTYTTDGAYTARLQVTDIRGAASDAVSQLINVFSGELPRIQLENLTDPNRPQFHMGDKWRYQVVRASGLAGLDPNAPYLWSISLYHDQHKQPLLSSFAADGIFEISRKEYQSEWNLHYHFELTMTTAQGQRLTFAQTLEPEVVQLQVDAKPIPVMIQSNSVVTTTAYSIKSVIGAILTLDAPPVILDGDTMGNFDYWYIYSDGWPVQATHDGEIIREPTLVFTAPNVHTEYIAFYSYAGPAVKLWLPLIALQ